MHQTLFEIPIFRYQVDDWKNKKKEVYSWINKTELIRRSNMTFLTDRAPLWPEVGKPRGPAQERFYKEDFSHKKNIRFFIFNKKKIFFSLNEYIRSQLKNIGVKNIEIINKDTYLRKNNFFSSRRSLKNKYYDYGRNISVIMIK